MADELGNNLPEGRRSMLAPEKANRENYVILLLTVDEEGFSRVCLLSPYQVVSTGPAELYFEVYQGSHTQRNLDKTKKATLVIPESTGLLYVRGNVDKFASKERSTTQSVKKAETNYQIVYHLTIAQVLRDKSDVAPITSQMKFDISTIGSEYQRTFEELISSVFHRK